MRIWPGRPYPLGRHVGWPRRELRPLQRECREGRAVPVRLGRRREGVRAHRARRAHRHGLARLPARRAAGAALRLSRPRPVRAGARAIASTPTSCCSIRTPRRSAGCRSRTDALSGYMLGDKQAGPVVQPADSAADAPLAAVIDEAFTWGDDRPPKTPLHHTIIYEVHVKGFTKLNADVREEDRGTYAGLGSEPAIRYLARARRHGRRAAAGARARRRPVPGRPRAGELLGLQHAGLLRPRPAVRLGRRTPEEVIREFKTMVRNLHDAGIEVILDVVYNHTAEGNQLGPTDVVPRHRQRQLLPPLARGPALLHGLHRLRQHAQHAQPARAAVHHGQPALLGDAHARRWVPLRSGQHAGPRAARSRQAGRVLRHHPPGPGAVAR